MAALLLAARAASAADVSFNAGVDRTEIALDEVVTLQARLETPEPPSRWEFPKTPDFEVVGQVQSQEQNVTLGGGGGVLIRQAITTAWQLRPTHPGALTIPSVKAVVRGREYLTQPIVIKVSAAGSPGPSAGGSGARGGTGAQSGGPSYRGWEKDVSFQVEVDRKEAYLGEQVIATFRLLARWDVLRAETSSPRYEGFWKEDLEAPRPMPSEERTVNGIPTRVFLVERVALFPTRTGELTIDPMEIQAQLRLPSRSFWGGDVVAVERRSAPVTIRVKPLPPGAPANFRPANIGALALAVSASPAQVAVGEPVTVRITVSGDGNVRALSPPSVPPFAGARVFQPTTRDQTEVRNHRLIGTRVVETVLVPEKTGEMVFALADWHYFDPGAGKYQSTRPPAVKVMVIPGALGASPAAPGSNVLTARIRPIRADLALSHKSAPPWRRIWFFAILLVPPLAFLGIAAVDQIRTRAGGARALRSAARTSRRRVAGARRRLSRGDTNAALAEVERALLGYSSGRLGHAAAGLTRETLSAELARAGAHPPAIRALLQALDLLDVSRYGAGDAHGEEVLIAAERALDLLEEADWQPEAEVGT